VLSQLAVDDKSNELTAVPKPWPWSLKGAIVTADALHSQRAIAEQLVAQGGDYVLALKGNQGTLHADVSVFLDDPQRPQAAAHTHHGRCRPWPDRDATAFLSTDIGGLQGRRTSLYYAAWRSPWQS
jgi:hypothetical protein